MAMLFQSGALFDSMTVLENVGFPLRQHTSISTRTLTLLAFLGAIFAAFPVHARTLLPPEARARNMKRMRAMVPEMMGWKYTRA